MDIDHFILAGHDWT